MNIDLQTGNQRYIFIQQKINKRKRRKKWSKPHKHKLNLYDRASAILKTGNFLDYIHMSEIDPYAMHLYKIYEYYCYLEKKILYYIKEHEDILSNENNLKIIIDFFIHIYKIQNSLLTYIYNFISAVYRIVLKNKFYGWRNYYTTEFAPLFERLIIENIKNLQYDVNKCKMSVYFFQIFWLSGIGLTKKISTYLKAEYNNIEENNQKIKIFSDKNTLYEHDNNDEIETLDIDDNEWINTYQSNENIKLISPENNIEKIEDDKNELSEYHIPESSSKIIEISLNDLELENILIDNNNDNNEDIIIDKSEIYEKITDYILSKLNINKDYIYNLSEKELEIFATSIRKQIKKNKIKLSENVINEIKNLLNIKKIN